MPGWSGLASRREGPAPAGLATGFVSSCPVWRCERAPAMGLRRHLSERWRPLACQADHAAQVISWPRPRGCADVMRARDDPGAISRRGAGVRRRCAARSGVAGDTAFFPPDAGFWARMLRRRKKLRRFGSACVKDDEVRAHAWRGGLSCAAVAGVALDRQIPMTGPAAGCRLSCDIRLAPVSFHAGCIAAHPGLAWRWKAVIHSEILRIPTRTPPDRVSRHSICPIRARLWTCRAPRAVLTCRRRPGDAQALHG